MSAIDQKQLESVDTRSKWTRSLGAAAWGLFMGWISTAMIALPALLYIAGAVSPEQAQKDDFPFFLLSALLSFWGGLLGGLAFSVRRFRQAWKLPPVQAAQDATQRI